MGHIDWLPIEEIPEGWKDGRPVLVWDGPDPYNPTHVPARVAAYDPEQQRGGEPYGWHDYYEPGAKFTPTHVAEINPPA